MTGWVIIAVLGLLGVLSWPSRHRLRRIKIYGVEAEFDPVCDHNQTEQ